MSLREITLASVGTRSIIPAIFAPTPVGGVGPVLLYLLPGAAAASHSLRIGICLAGVVHERREEHRFLLSAWVFLPDHRHAIFYPPFPLTAPITRSGLSVDRITIPPPPAPRI